jgi:hypothetical protein
MIKSFNVIVRTFYLFLFFILSSQSLAQGLEPLEIPENYEEQKKELSQREQWVPPEATQATSLGSLGGRVLKYHLSDVLEKNKFKSLKSLESLEQSMNKSTELNTKSFSLKSKLDVQKMRAEVDFDSFVSARVWTEDSFTTLRAQMKLYEVQDGLLSLENRRNAEDNRTYLNIEKTW